jgi:hypothetical protein
MNMAILFASLTFLFMVLKYFNVKPNDIRQAITKSLNYPLNFEFKGSYINTTPSALFDAFGFFYFITTGIFIAIFGILFSIQLILNGFHISPAFVIIGFFSFAYGFSTLNSNGNFPLKFTALIVAVVLLSTARGFILFNL